MVPTLLLVFVTIQYGTVVTWTAAPLLAPSVVTTAVRLPRAVGGEERVTINWVPVALVTVPGEGCY